MGIKNVLEQVREVQELFDASDDPEKLRQALENKDLEEAAKYTSKTDEEIVDLFSGLMEGIEENIIGEDNGRESGVVDFFHERKGYGFIVVDGGERGDDSVFFGFKDSAGFDIEEGDRVTFEIEEGRGKGPRAVNLEKES